MFMALHKKMSQIKKIVKFLYIHAGFTISDRYNVVSTIAVIKLSSRGPIKMNFKIFVLVIPLLFIVTTNSEYQSYRNYKVFRVVPKTEDELNELKDLDTNFEYQLWSEVAKINESVKILVPPNKQLEFEELLVSKHLAGEIAIENVEKLIEAQLGRPKLNRINNDYDWNYYQTFEEIMQWMNNIVEEHSDVAELVNIGTTYEGRHIIGIKIDYQKRENSTVGVLEGGIHAREWISPATMTWVINEFLTSDDEEIRSLAENIVWHIFPVVNPDGYVYTFTNNRMWRKNRNPENHTPCGTWGVSDDLSNGIDLNRNFGFMWMTIGASDNPCAETYAGPTANSELETRAIINYVQSLRTSGDNVVYYFAFHSFSQMVLVPYSHVRGSDVLEAPNYADMYEIAIKGTDALRIRNGTNYIVGTSGDILYYVSGSSFDWARGVADIPIVYLFELRDDGDKYGFLLPPELIKDNNREIMDALIEMDKVTQQLGYYHRTNAAVNQFINIFLFILSLLFVL